jgi:hypothetical protein
MEEKYYNLLQSNDGGDPQLIWNIEFTVHVKLDVLLLPR